MSINTNRFIYIITHKKCICVIIFRGTTICIFLPLLFIITSPKLNQVEKNRNNQFDNLEPNDTSN
ncbi:hypothetical protein BD408DRAFT_407873 [Parasitella parasitica]|nr:hypothetical protein BD408DRAFT_407873 [Parasitella parasitica]